MPGSARFNRQGYFFPADGMEVLGRLLFVGYGPVCRRSCCVYFQAPVLIHAQRGVIEIFVI